MAIDLDDGIIYDGIIYNNTYMVTIYDGNIDLQMIFSARKLHISFGWIFPFAHVSHLPRVLEKNTMYNNQWEISRIQLMEVRKRTIFQAIFCGIFPEI